MCRLQLLKWVCYLPILFVCLLCFQLHAQTDSLQKVATDHQIDTVRMQAYSQLINQLTYSNTQQALVHANNLLLLAIEKENFHYQAIAEKSIGNQYYLQGNFALAMEHYLTALRLIEDHNMADQTAGIRHNIGNIHVRWRHAEKALRYFNEARILNLANDNKSWLINNYMSIGIVHKDLLDNNDSAIYYHNQALSLSREIDFTNGIIGCLVNLGACYIKQKKLDDANQVLLEALSILQANGIRNNLDRVYEKLGIICYERGAFAEAVKFYSLSKKEMDETNQANHLAGWYTNMASLYSATGRYKQAFEMMSTALQMNDSIFSFKEKNQLAELEAQYDIANANKEVELARKDAIIAQQKQQRGEVLKRVWVGVALAALLLALLIFSAYRINRKNLKLLAAKSLELNQTNNQLAQANHKLNDLVVEKNNILHIVAHDLRTPLAKVRALSDLLSLDAQLSEKQKERLHKINVAVDEGSQMMQDLLDAQREDVLHREVTKSPIYPKEVITNLVAHYKANIRLKKLKMILHADEGTFITDEHRLKRMVDNLLSNAIKYSPEGKIVELSCTVRAEMLRVRIADQGPGFTIEDKAAMFQHFQKLSAQPVGQGSSHGVGLAIVKRMADELGATLKLESEQGKGAVWILELV